MNEIKRDDARVKAFTSAVSLARGLFTQAVPAAIARRSAMAWVPADDATYTDLAIECMAAALDFQNAAKNQALDMIREGLLPKSPNKQLSLPFEEVA